LVEEIERREEMAAALRARALEQTRCMLVEDGGSEPAAKWPCSSTASETMVEVISVEEIESDLSE
jgi:hypothetical protein